MKIPSKLLAYESPMEKDTRAVEASYLPPKKRLRSYMEIPSKFLAIRQCEPPVKKHAKPTRVVETTSLPSKKRMHSGADWSYLHKDMLEEIAARVAAFDVVDYLKFRDVCTSWRSAFVEGKKKLPSLIPWIFSYDSADKRIGVEEHKFKYSLVNPFNNKLQWLNSWRVRTEYCGGSSKGWILMADWNKSNEVHLLNPLTNMQVPLPSIRQPYMIENVVLSSPPISGDDESCVVMAIVCDRSRGCAKWQLAFCKPGDDIWTMIGGQLPHYVDITYCNGLFYVLSYNEILAVFCDACKCGPSPKPIEICKLPESVRGNRCHLVESSGDLLLISVKIYNKKVTILKVDLIRQKWLEVTNIGDQTVFVSDHNSISMLASTHPLNKPNCIYLGYFDWLGIYNLKDASYEAFLCNRRIRGTECTWITPSPW
ncbi:hypothetical protein GIB67_034947 [Kingdonia uniflora]|uniref:KIB1-4 beta-propeller domain-containing protein n=1 Tax=Kingdonia uniflora TaxID=39325 RepID=A0A7J7NGT4_9MAGN|nr:hypothetical protein GIB67_034947 [Kingdonia uniflora]